MARPEPESNQAEFASDLGWHPGLWPYRFVRSGTEWELLRKERNGDGDVTAVHYTARDGRRLIVFND